MDFYSSIDNAFWQANSSPGSYSLVIHLILHRPELRPQRNSPYSQFLKQVLRQRTLHSFQTGQLHSASAGLRSSFHLIPRCPKTTSSHQVYPVIQHQVLASSTLLHWRDVRIYIHVISSTNLLLLIPSLNPTKEYKSLIRSSLISIHIRVSLYPENTRRIPAIFPRPELLIGRGSMIHAIPQRPRG